MKLLSNTVDLFGLDCHIHSIFSPDAKRAGADEPSVIAQKVRERGLRGFIVTDHIDVGHWDGYIIDFDKYFRTWEKVRADNPDLTIYIGLEAGFEEVHAKETARIIDGLPFEYVINSAHYFPSDASGKLAVYNAYLTAVLKSLDAPYGFSAIGHLGFPERYAPYPPEERAMDYGTFAPLLDKIIARAIELGVRFEENTNGGGEMRLPRADFLKAYKAAGGTRPVLGSDAHTSGAIGQYFAEATEFLNGIFGK